MNGPRTVHGFCELQKISKARFAQRSRTLRTEVRDRSGKPSIDSNDGRFSGPKQARMRLPGAAAAGSPWFEASIGLLVPLLAVILLLTGIGGGSLRAEREVAHRNSMLERVVVGLEGKSFEELASLQRELAYGGSDERYRVDLEVQRRGEGTLEIHAVLVDRHRNRPIDRLVTFRQRR